MKTKLVAMIALGALASPLAALADETLTYTSSALEGTYSNFTGKGEVQNGSTFTFSLDLTIPLTANMNNVNVSSYVTKPVTLTTFDPSNPSVDNVVSVNPFEGEGSSIYLSTNSKGAITGWDFTEGVTEPSNVSQDILIHSCYNDSCTAGSYNSQYFGATGDWYDFEPGATTGQSDGCTYSPPGNCGTSAGSSGSVGSWSVTSAPELDPTSAASGLVVLVGSLAVLGGRRRRTSGFTAVA